MRSLASFQGIHSGEKIVVCGCGVSLKGFESPERFVTIGVNDVGRLFHPKYLLVVDPPRRFKGGRFHYVETSQAEYLFTQRTDLGVAHTNIVNFRLGKKDGVDFSDPAVLHYSVVSPYTALYLAAYMGASSIGLIGVDFTDHHFFADTGPHEWNRYVNDIDEQFNRLGVALLCRGIKVFNLSRSSRLNAFPKMDLEAFASLTVQRNSSQDSFTTPLRLVSYAVTAASAVPAALATCINARSRHTSRSVSPSEDGGNALTCNDLNSRDPPAHEAAEPMPADVIVVHDGEVAARHRPLLEGKAVITMAHSRIANVHSDFILQGFPGVVLGQNPAALREFRAWSIVPNPIPLWDQAFQPGIKDDVVKICYSPSVDDQQSTRVRTGVPRPRGSGTISRILKKLESEYPIRVSSGDMDAIRQAHIVVDDCVTGGYRRNSLEGLAAGCIVVNGVGLESPVMDAIRHCVGEQVGNPFTQASLVTLEEVLRGLIERGPEGLAQQGALNRRWMERHWDFSSQWERCWQPVIEEALHARAARRKVFAPPPASASPVVDSLNEDEYLRRTIDSFAGSQTEGSIASPSPPPSELSTFDRVAGAATLASALVAAAAAGKPFCPA